MVYHPVTALSRARGYNILKAIRCAVILLTAMCGLTPKVARAQAQQQVTVQLFQSKGRLAAVYVDPPLQIQQPLARRIGTRVRLQARHGQVELAFAGREKGEPIAMAPAYVLQGTGGRTRLQLPDGTHRSYAGTIKVYVSSAGLAVSNSLAARDYIKSVVSSETLPMFPLESLKAQSVLAQTLIAKLKPGDWLPDTTERQAYIGADAVRGAVSEAVDQTWGQQLTYKGAPVAVYFHSTCAGGTSNGESYFRLRKGGYPYLGGVTCSYCRNSPFWHTKIASVPHGVWSNRVGAAVPHVVMTDERGRPLTVQVGASRVSGYEMWMKVGQRLGWDKMPGTRYEIKEVGGGQVELSSTGAGHGVGLCQWGASGLAGQGMTYRQILEYYFPGTAVTSKVAVNHGQEP